MMFHIAIDILRFLFGTEIGLYNNFPYFYKTVFMHFVYLFV